MVLTLANWAFFQFSNIFYSRSLSKVWDWAHERPVHCWNVNQLLLAGGGMTVTPDVVIIVLPIRETMRLGLSPKKRLEITPIFVVGIITLIISTIRVWKIYDYANSHNPTWNNVPGDHWSVLKANISVFCVCMRCIASSCDVCLDGEV
ncbi:hypothetical protein HBH70_071230 [Parastagonospora nodorum]|nr:hypothetical protein HBI78_061620 [Parastagonospora nodorum]KAH5143041.1 hypothetical protein HBH70_071230 [Parastagonospora nodorum]